MRLANLISLIFSLLILISLSTFSFNERFLNETAISYFSSEDWQIFTFAKNEALNHRKDGVKLTWKNPQTGHYGYIIPSDTHQEHGMTCRKLTIFNYANYRQGKGTLTFCKMGRMWKVM